MPVILKFKMNIFRSSSTVRVRVENGSFLCVNLVVKNSANAVGNSKNVFCDNVVEKAIKFGACGG